jgi:hypothetical protein
MNRAQNAERRAQLLVRCYPPGWRARYGEEFVQLLVDEISECPRSLSRTVDVLWSGLVARLASAGLAGDALEPQAQLRAGLAALSLSFCAFLAAGVAIWAQLTIGWQWSAPSASATKTGMLPATLWITSDWAHPGALASFPASEIGWMVVSPLALGAMLIGATKALRRLRVSPRVLRYELWLGLAAGLVMAGFLAGAASWIISGGPGPRGLFRVGAIDSVGVAVMASALIVAFRATQRTLAVHPGETPLS